MQPFISVIIPVYQSEQWLGDCLESVLAQKVSGLEILVIDDGSFDRSREICLNFQIRDGRIRYFRQEHAGLSAARNRGIEESSGEYLFFLDSDDLLAQGLLEHLYHLAETHGVDTVISPLTSFSGIPGRLKAGTSISLLEPEQALEAMLYQRLFDAEVCGKLFRRSLFKGIRFGEGRLFEDVTVTATLLQNSRRIALTGQSGYHYRIRPDSLQHRPFSAEMMDLFTAMEELEMLVIFYPALYPAWQCRMLSAACFLLMKIPPGEIPEAEALLWKAAKVCRKKVLPDRKARPKNRIAAFISFFGKRALRWVYRLRKG